MTSFSLYERLHRLGTLSEPRGVADPAFALPSTVNWMRGLAFLVDDLSLSFKAAKDFYSGTVKKEMSL